MAQPWLAFVPLAWGLLCGIAQHAAPAFHAEARLVVLHVTVTNRRGEPITTLDRSAFRVYENGRPQSIAVFGRDDVPVSLGLVIDNSSSMRSIRENVEAAALALVRASNPLDEAFVLNFADTPRIDVPFTSDIHVLEAGVARASAIGGTAVRDAILDAERYMREHSTRDRRALILITDGKDNTSSVEPRALRRIVEQNDAAIFWVRLASNNPDGKDAVDGDLERIVEHTGGVTRRASSLADVDTIMLDIAAQIRSQYTVAYTPAVQALDGSYRSIRVTVRAPGEPVARTRQGYWATPARFDP
jgi:Ca-activated chloride channel homolog